MSDDTSRGGCLPRGDVVSPYDASGVYWSRSQNMICSSSEADHIGRDSCSPDYIKWYDISLFTKFILLYEITLWRFTEALKSGWTGLSISYLDLNHIYPMLVLPLCYNIQLNSTRLLIGRFSHTPAIKPQLHVMKKEANIWSMYDVSDDKYVDIILLLITNCKHIFYSDRCPILTCHLCNVYYVYVVLMETPPLYHCMSAFSYGSYLYRRTSQRPHALK